MFIRAFKSLFANAKKRQTFLGSYLLEGCKSSARPFLLILQIINCFCCKTAVNWKLQSINFKLIWSLKVLKNVNKILKKNMQFFKSQRVKIHVCHLTSVFPTRICLKFLINLHFSNKRYNNYYYDGSQFVIIPLKMFSKESFCQKFCASFATSLDSVLSKN